MAISKHFSISFYWKILKNSISSFIDKDTFTQSAALAYYVVFSLPPMLFIVFWSAGLWYKEAQVREAVFDEYGELIGQEGAMQLMTTLEGLTSSQPTWWATILGVGILVFTASTVFVTMKNTLNKIFEVKVTRSVTKGILMMLLDRFLSIAMLCIIALILTLSMVGSAMITAFGDAIENWMGDSVFLLLFFDHIVLNLLILTVLFAITYRYMPDSKLDWRDTWFGAFFTAVLFVVGKSFIEIFIGSSQAANFYDAAGGVLVLMLWVYYTSAIFFFGAYVTHIHAELSKENKDPAKQSIGGT